MQATWFSDPRYGRFSAGCYVHRIDGTDGFGVAYRATGPTLNGAAMTPGDELASTDGGRHWTPLVESADVPIIVVGGH